MAVYMHLADLRSYLQADERLCELYRTPDDSAKKSILNIAGSGKFSSDRAIFKFPASSGMRGRLSGAVAFEVDYGDTPVPGLLPEPANWGQLGLQG